MIDPDDPMLQALIREGCTVSLQLYMAPGRLPRYTAVVRRPNGSKAQGWGNSPHEALMDAQTRAVASPRPVIL